MKAKLITTQESRNS